ncbi:hypothetical protein THARTR1_08480 [Trichoderma harzianum]|uniref:Uncharacterized protein n=1 Tax=Trichoderma harzianum TaxID=5544 RepID=A0A2K0TZA5_TRIHA|nr:hypothetical protein THARTR1_08480 [Trichoderma harzianum]
MAEPQEPYPGADRIRSLTDQDAIFNAFDAYPWTKDSAFLSGLRAILGVPNSSNPQGSLRDIATHARIFYYAQRIGVQIDFAAYHAWLAQNPDRQPPHIIPEEYEQPSSSSPSSSSATPWQQAAPKADLYVDRSAQAHSSEGEPSYPLGFAEMIKLLQEGKPIPGIRQIPNTIERDATVKPVGSRPVPRKPWEKEASVNAEAGAGVENTLDLEFPPVEQQNAAAAATGSS